MIKEKTFNPKKHKEQRRKRPAVSLAKPVKHVEVEHRSKAGVIYKKYKLVSPAPERGMNRKQYRIQLAKDRKDR